MPILTGAALAGGAVRALRQAPGQERGLRMIIENSINR